MTLFKGLDSSGQGVIHIGDIVAFGASAFAGMDADDDAKVTYGAFSTLDPGSAHAAEQGGRSEAYTTASKIAFAIWAGDGNGDLTEREMRFALAADVRGAHADDDGLLTETEFSTGFPIMVAMRAALRPDFSADETGGDLHEKHP